MNQIVLCGHLVKDSETNSSGKVAENCIAVDRALKDRDGNKQTDFINIRWIGEKKAQFAEKYMKKGVKVIVVGNLQIDKYKDKNGNSRQWVYVLVNSVEFAESKAAQERAKGQTQPQEQVRAVKDDSFLEIDADIDEELPFN